jgi:hypothetical protein
MDDTYFKAWPLLMFFLPLTGHGQTPLKVSLCDLVKQPEKYTRQWVEVRGAVNLGFEDFTLRTRACGEKYQIWLAYGGDEPTPTMSTVNDLERRPGVVPKVDGIPVTLQRDANLELLKGRLAARRVTAPDGSMCDAECRLYDVTGTLVGLFMAAPKGARPLSGYGHLGCCHLLMIQRVTDVEAVRTEVPAGGRFACSKETWEMDQAQSGKAFQRRACTDMRDCEKAVGQQFGMVAEHWGDEIDTNKGSVAGFMSGAPVWRSADLLTTYSLTGHYSDQRRQTGTLLGATATRTACNAAEAPFPLATPIHCKTLFSDFRGSKKTPAQGKSWPGSPETVARDALEEAAKRWGLDLMPGLKLEECIKPPVVLKGTQFTWCQWSEPTAMQSFSIQVSRSHALHQLRAWDNALWTLTRGHGLACVAEAQ